MAMVDLKQYMTSRSEMIERKLDQLVPEQQVPHVELYRAARYSLLNGGKRLRPILSMATAEALGGNIEAILIPACALEMIHTYSLIHDDLPCMDDDDFRRGKPSLHKAFPEGQAVLAGDFLLTHAFEILSHAENLNIEKRIKLIAILSRQAGGNGMIAGQMMDLEAEGKQIYFERLRLIHRKKTGAMITASIEFGGIVADASEKQMEILRLFGNDIGLAFQIIDDVLDVTSSKQKHGKDIASDVINSKATYVSLLGLEQSQAMAQSLLQSAIERVRYLGSDPTLLIKLATQLVDRTS
jgi:geranylgeranyl diphosphate synthase, type II